MTAQDLDSREAALSAERDALLGRIRALEDDVHTVLMRDPHANADRIGSVEREIRKIVLRLVEIEREQIEVRIAASL
jgi:hypothetical protein